MRARHVSRGLVRRATADIVMFMFMEKRRLAEPLLIALAAFCAAAASLEAQAPPVQPPVVVDVEVIVPGEIADTSGAASVLTDEQLRTLRPFTLHDALRFVPGVRTLDDDVLGRRAGIAVRGAPSRRSRKTLLLEDGVPINASAYLDPSAHYTPPMERLERLDVLKGAGHLLHGPLNNHGIINFRNKRPTLAPETSAVFGLGNLGTFRRHLMHRRTDGPVGLVFAYTGADAQGAFDVEDHRYDDLFGSVDLAMGERHQIGLSSTSFRERSSWDESNLTPQEFAIAPRVKRGRYGEEFNLLALNYTKLDAVHHFRASDRFSMSSRAFLTNLDRPRFAADPGASPVDLLPGLAPEEPFLPGASGRMVGRDRHYRTTGVDARFALSGLRPGGPHTLQWGLRAEQHRLDDRRRHGEEGQVLAPATRGVMVRHDAYAANAVSGFIESTWQVGTVTLTPGVRIEHYTQSRHPLPSRDAGPEGRPRLEDANTLVLPSLSALLARWTGTSVFANIGRGYTPAFARTAVGFPLDPETGINSQVGVRTTAIRALSVEAAAFYNRLTDTVVQLPFTIDQQGIFINSEDSRSYGVDAAARVDSASLTRDSLNLFLTGVYTFTRARFAGGMLSGNSVPEIPLHTGSLSAGVEHVGGWHASLTIDSSGRFFSDPSNIIPFTLADEDGFILGPGDAFDVREPVVLGRVPGRTLLSGRVSYTVRGTPATIWIQGRNLADRLYVADVANGLRPGAARTITAGVRVVF